ncbi:MAG: hypothetical protein K2G77_01165 [Muribaculaceae bacterium]|nr:hypothetical protein [Muribaculaceae bacterium]
MNIRGYFTLFPLLAILCACQSEMPQENILPKRVLTVRAMLPGSEDTRGYITFGDSEHNTRAQITYGNKNRDKEIFMWDKAGYGGLTQNDYIALYNVTRLSQYPYEGIQLDVTKIDGRNATFESVPTDVELKAGDLIFVNYGNTGIKYGPDSVSYDERKIFSIGVGTEANKPQFIVKNPNDSSLAYMHDNLRMYDIVKLVEDDSIPDLHFKHLSAILRVTLRNETDKYIYPTKLEFKYPGTESFFNTTLYCSVDTTLSSGLNIYIEDAIFKGSKPYTDNIGTTINGKEGTKDVGDSIAPGQTYELYLSTVPRIENDRKGDQLIIDLIKKHDTDHPYRITLDKFNTIIEAGKRYWFKLTAVEEDGENKLMLTSKWLDLHPDKKTPEDE